MAEAVEDAAIISELEGINDKLDTVNSRLNTTNSTLDNIDDNVYTIGQDFEAYSGSFDNYVIFYGNNTEAIVGYLHFFLITIYALIGVFMISKVAKWIEFLICDR